MDQSKTAPELSVVMPCLNEEETIGRCIEKAQRAIEAAALNVEILVSDNGSDDNSQKIARDLGARVIEIAQKGYGAALMGGIEAARGRYILMGDADDSYDFREISRFLAKLREGYDLVMGCRFPAGDGTIMPGAMPWSHRWGNPLLSWINRLFFKSNVTDAYCGMRAFKKSVIKGLNLRSTGMEFAYEMIVKADLRGLRITEIPITLYKDGRSRPPHLRTWRDGWRTLRFLLLYSPNWLFLIPGSVLFCIGLMAGVWLTISPMIVFGIGFDTNTLLVCAMMMLIGFQLIVFALFAKIFAISEGLLPSSERLASVFKVFTLEVGILTGLGLAVCGFSLLVYSVFYWSEHSFGALSYPDSLRIVIPGITLLTLGIETVFSSFFISILGILRK